MNKKLLIGFVIGSAIIGLVLYNNAQQRKQHELESRIRQEAQDRERAENAYRQLQWQQAQEQAEQLQQLRVLQGSVNEITNRQRRADSIICLGGWIPDGSGGCFNPR